MVRRLQLQPGRSDPQVPGVEPLTRRSESLRHYVGLRPMLRKVQSSNLPARTVPFRAGPSQSESSDNRLTTPESPDVEVTADRATLPDPRSFSLTPARGGFRAHSHSCSPSPAQGHAGHVTGDTEPPSDGVDLRRSVSPVSTSHASATANTSPVSLRT